MNTTDQEIEAKFYLHDLAALERRLESLGAQRVQERVYESNLRFDTPDLALGRSQRALRLRQDSVARITYKGPGEIVEGARVRQELEFTVSDFATARAVLEALGYWVVVMYEKYRTTYTLEDVLITLDEMPYGLFSEIEGPSGQRIEEIAGRLGLDWPARINDSYIMLFDHLRQVRSLPFNDLSFANFASLQISAADLGVRVAQPME